MAFVQSHLKNQFKVQNNRQEVDGNRHGNAWVGEAQNLEAVPVIRRLSLPLSLSLSLSAARTITSSSLVFECLLELLSRRRPDCLVPQFSPPSFALKNLAPFKHRIESPGPRSITGRTPTRFGSHNTQVHKYTRDTAGTTKDKPPSLPQISSDEISERCFGREQLLPVGISNGCECTYM